ncbi:MAG TPA: prepilin-type N-terminal cleavage/methylation domain-containing protein [Vicinamibacterales bacterium]|nr:prepilin-type N-terminal cleavage/methylation domain-containing protein [Vicinamibacterales bacterium]
MMEAARRTSRTRAGFTIVELIVAMLMLTIGLLGLAGVGAVVLKQMKSGTYQTIAASIAQSRFEQFEGDPCNSISSGSATVRGMTETWTASAVGIRAKAIQDTVTFSGTTGTKKVGIHTVVSCTP